MILKEEQLADGFSVEEVAGWADGYSGSDLRALCTAAAYRPIRDLLAREASAAALLEAAPPAGAALPSPPEDTRNLISLLWLPVLDADDLARC